MRERFSPVSNNWQRTVRDERNAVTNDFLIEGIR